MRFFGAAVIFALALLTGACESEEPPDPRKTALFTEQLPPGSYYADRDGRKYELYLDLGAYKMLVDRQLKYSGTWTLGAGYRIAIDDRNTLVCSLDLGFGTYDWELDGDKLSFDVADQKDELCEERKKDWGHDDWVRGPDTPAPSPSPAAAPSPP